MRNKIVYKLGDKVKIITPEVFLRVGYPLTKQDVINSFTEEQNKGILELLEKFGVKIMEGFDIPYENVNCIDKIKDTLAFRILQEKSFGGSVRSIHTENKPELLGKIARVENKKVVKTGVRDYYQDGSWEEGYSCSIPYLNKVKTHVILELFIGYDVIPDNGRIWIEEKNVEKYAEEKLDDSEIL